MGKKKQALRELEEDVVNAEEELSAVKWELATVINRNIELSDENDQLQRLVADLKEVIVCQAMALVDAGQETADRLRGTVDLQHADLAEPARWRP